MLGFPIRTSPDQRSVANSPGHFAGSHVLHRLSMPRHPPCALNNLPTTNHQHTQTNPHNVSPSRRLECSPMALQWDKPIKRTHKTINSIRNNTFTRRHQPRPIKSRSCYAGGCSRPLSRSQTTRSRPAPQNRRDQARLMPQTPNSVPCVHTPHDHSQTAEAKKSEQSFVFH